MNSSGDSYQDDYAGQTNESMASSIAEAVARRISSEYTRARVSTTFGEIYATWLKNYVKPHLAARSAREYESLFSLYFARWKDMNVYDIRRSAVQEWTSALGQTGIQTAANKAVEMMRAVYNKAIEWELLPDNYNPATNIRKFKRQSRERFLQAEELPRFFQALQTLRYQTTQDFILLALLTGARRSNVAAMRWDEIDLTRAVWTVPKTKNGTSQVIPLTPLAQSLLKRRKANAQSDWVLPSKRSPSGHLTKPEKAWKELITRAELGKHLTVHDLRRSLGSWEAITGANISVIAKTLNHKDLNSTQIYARLNVDDQRKAMDKAISALLLAAGVPEAQSTEEQEFERLGPSFELDADNWVGIEDAARISKVSISVLENLRQNNDGPPYLKAGFSVQYKPSMLRAWMHNRNARETKLSASQAPADNAILPTNLLRSIVQLVGQSPRDWIGTSEIYQLLPAGPDWEQFLLALRHLMENGLLEPSGLKPLTAAKWRIKNGAHIGSLNSAR